MSSDDDESSSGLLRFEDPDDLDDEDDDWIVKLPVKRSACKFVRRRCLIITGLALIVVSVLVIVVAVPVAVTVHKSSQSTPSPSPTPTPSPGHTSTPSPSPTSTPSPSPTSTPSPSPTSTPSVSCLSGEVCAGKMDSRTYKVATLNNQLRVLVISDPDSNVSAASMDVAVGSFSNPPQVLGLAHFCEHMLFLGTEKYPDEHEYSTFLKTHGGSDNAFTSSQETNYFFSVDAGYLNGALDRFAQFFISPLFNANATGREMNAVNSEHEKNLHSDGWRAYEVLKNVSNPMHPFSQFSTGSIETLNKSNISAYLNQFYMSYYSANQMQLVIYGRDSADTLMNWAEDIFSHVPNHNVSTPSFSTTSFPSPEFTQKIVYYYPVANADSLTLYWQTPPLEEHYRSATSSFLSRNLGDEGVGSLLQYLRMKQWASGLSAGVTINTDTYTLMSVSVDLTQSGLLHADEVVAATFQYIRLLQSQSEAKLAELWKSNVKVAQLNFDYQQKSEPSDYAVAVAQAMRLVSDPADFLGNPRRFILNTSLITSTLSHLTPSNSVLFISTQQLNVTNGTKVPCPHQMSPTPLPWPELTMIEPYYGSAFAIVSTPDDVLQSWMENVVDSGVLSLPGPNMFIPEDLNLVAPGGGASVPVKISNGQPGVSLWWLQDSQFLTPRVNLYCSIRPYTAENTTQWTALSTLYVSLVAQALTPHLYPASLVGYSVGISSDAKGLTLSLSGFSDPTVVNRLINKVIQALPNGTIVNDKAVFELTKETLIENTVNYNYTTLPYSYTYNYIQSVVMERPYHKLWQQTLELSTATLTDVLQHATNSLFNNATLLCFVHGNVNQTQAQNYANLFSNGFSLGSEQPVGSYARQRVSLSPGNYSVTLGTLNPDDGNSVINVVFQVGRVCDPVFHDQSTVPTCSSSSLRTEVHLQLLSQIMGDECFYQLRTVEQLGYVVFCFATSNDGVGSFQMLVQSPSRGPGYLLQRIDAFLDGFADYLGNMTSSNFTDQTNVLKSTLQRKDITLSDQSKRFWGEIQTGRLQFKYALDQIPILSTVNTSSLLDFYCSYLQHPATYKKMVIGVYGDGQSGDLNANITNPIDYKNITSQLHYP